MASAPATHQNEENKLSTEEPIASRLRSNCRIQDVQTSHTGEIDVNNYQSEDKPSLLSKNQKGKSKNSAAKESKVHNASTSKTGQPSTDNHKGSEVHTAKKSNGSTTPKGSEVHISSSCTRRLPSKDSSETKRKEQDLKNKHAKSKDSQPQSETKACSTGKTSKNSKGQELEKTKSSAPKKSNTGETSCSHLGKEKEKTRPSVKFNLKSIKERPVYHIRWKGFGELSTRHNCSLCDKDIAYSPNEEKWKYPIHEENELEYSIFSPMVEEQRQCAILPEVAILRCSHVFHSTCLSETLMQHSDPPCPICNMS